MFSYEYQGNLSQARTANKAQFQHPQASGRVGPYTKLQSNPAAVREPPVNARDNQPFDEPEDDADYSFSHLPVRERRKLFLADTNNMSNRNTMPLNQSQRGRQSALKARRSNIDTQSDYGGDYYGSPSGPNQWSNAAPSTGGWASHGGTLQRGGKSSSPIRYQNGNTDHHVRSQSMHTSTRIFPKSSSRTLDYAAQRLDNLENSYQTSWNSSSHQRPVDLMTQSAYQPSSQHHTPVFHRSVTGPATRVIPLKNWHDQGPSGGYHQQQSQPLKINVYNSDTYATSAAPPRHTPIPQTPQMRHPPGQRGHTPGYGAITIPVKPTPVAAAVASSRFVNLGPPPSRMRAESQRNTPGPPSPSPIRPGGRAYFDEEAGVSEF